MGADLYIWANRGERDKKSKLPDGAPAVHSGLRAPMSKRRDGSQRREESEKEPVFSEAYFRDSYNLSSVLWTCGLSWWRDVLPLLNNDLELIGENLTRFRNQFASAEQHLPTADDLVAEGVQLKETGANSLRKLREYHVRKRKELLAFLDLAIEKGLPILCSL
jgi:hypothetical protein